ncbi:hypothetical protein RvY_15782 [Ramazzottius varieornatus]|uniref:BTB domain-containing protein n=1 Tax=Ramazzottius varieornatus TaxID=947166 RepID=A0A1D1W3Y7_RAMVA|nr:hypothetical protein RvY_15782 [Ramazzottius varieornatus]
MAANQEDMDAPSLKLAIQNHRKFITECKLVETETLSVYAKEVGFDRVEVKTAFENGEPLQAISEYSIPCNAHNFSAEVERIQELPSLQLTPFVEINWSIDLELLPIIDDATMSFNFRVPLEDSRVLKELELVPKMSSSSPGTSSSSSSAGGPSRTERLRTFREGIAARLTGKRQNDTRRSLTDTLSVSRDPSNPTCVLLAVIRWDGPAAAGLSVSGLTLKIGSYEMTLREPIEMYCLAENCVVVDSTNVHSWTSPHGHQGYGHDKVQGAHPRGDWLKPNHQIYSGSSIRMSLTLKHTDYSIPRIGFPFSQFSDPKDRESYYRDAIDVIKNNTRQSDAVKISGVGEEYYYVSRELLASSSGYFRAFLTDAWSRSFDQCLLFPQMAPFTAYPEIVPMVLYYLVERRIPFGISELVMELIQAADALDMPALSELAQIAAISNLTKENVTQVVRFAWEFRANLLLRASLIFLRTNYDEIYMKDKKDVADMARLLSSPRFMDAFMLVDDGPK